MFNLVRVGKEWAGPVFPHPLTSNFMFYAYSGQGNLRLAEFFPTPLTICTTVFPHVITLCIRLIFNLVRVGKEWACLVFSHPLKSNGYVFIHDRVLRIKVRLSVLLCAVKMVEGDFRFCWTISPNVGQTHKENPNLVRIFYMIFTLNVVYKQYNKLHEQ